MNEEYTDDMNEEQFEEFYTELLTRCIEQNLDLPIGGWMYYLFPEEYPKYMKKYMEQNHTYFSNYKMPEV